MSGVGAVFEDVPPEETVYHFNALPVATNGDADAF